jgi:hypothetical protein
MMVRKAAALARLKDPHCTIEVACFLRLRRLQLTFGTEVTTRPSRVRRPERAKTYASVLHAMLEFGFRTGAAAGRVGPPGRAPHCSFL